MEPIGIVVLLGLAGIGALWGLAQQNGERQRREREEAERQAMVMKKYAGSPYAEDILRGLVRQGMTPEMVLDSWGSPAAVDRKVYKTKVKEVWKYGPGPRRTFSNRVTIEDGVVVGFESR